VRIAVLSSPYSGAVFGDVCITIPEGRFDPAQEPKLGRLLVSAAADISADARRRLPARHVRGRRAWEEDLPAADVAEIELGRAAVVEAQVERAR
jgi:hypothetical protein